MENGAGLFDDPRSQVKAQQLMAIATFIALLYIASFIWAVADYDWAVRVVEVALNATGLVETVDPDDPLRWASDVTGLILSLLIPFCGYYGAKNRDNQCILLFCICSGFFAVITAISIWGFAAILEYCEEANATSQCWWSLVLSCMVTGALCLGSAVSWSLLQDNELYVVNNVPAYPNNPPVARVYTPQGDYK